MSSFITLGINVPPIAYSLPKYNIHGMTCLSKQQPSLSISSHSKMKSCLVFLARWSQNSDAPSCMEGTPLLLQSAGHFSMGCTHGAPGAPSLTMQIPTEDPVGLNIMLGLTYVKTALGFEL